MLNAGRARHLPRLLAAGLLMLAACLLLSAPAAEARIVPQQGIGGIALNMTRAEVVAAKGKPDAERFVHHELIGRQRMVRYGRTRAFFGGFARNARVVTVNTLDPNERTVSDVGIGSTIAEVRRGVGGVTCRKEFGIHNCFKGRFRAGERVTVFDISRQGTVDLVVVGFVID